MTDKLLDEVWEWLKKTAKEKKLDYIAKDGKEVIRDRKNKVFYIKCQAKDFQKTRVVNL